MKKTILFILTFLFTIGAYSQDEKIVSIDINKLPPETKNLIEKQLNEDAQKQAIQKDIETYADWAGKGKEIGTAVKEGLGAVKDVTIELAESDVGKITIWLIVWKVIGKDIVQIISGALLFIITTTLLTISYFKTFAGKIKIESQGLFKYKKWEKVNPNKNWEDPDAAALIHLLFWLILTITSIAVMFA